MRDKHTSEFSRQYFIIPPFQVDSTTPYGVNSKTGPLGPDSLVVDGFESCEEIMEGFCGEEDYLCFRTEGDVIPISQVIFVLRH